MSEDKLERLIYVLGHIADDLEKLSSVVRESATKMRDYALAREASRGYAEALFDISRLKLNTPIAERVRLEVYNFIRERLGFRR